MPPDTLDDSEEFYTWILVGDPTEASLINNIPNLNTGRPLPPKNQVDSYHFELSVTSGQRPALRATTAAKKWLFEESERNPPVAQQSKNWAEPDEFVLISSAPKNEIEQVWGKACSYNGKYYQFLPILFEHSCPYQHRLLALRYIGKELPGNTEPMGISIPTVEDKDQERIAPNLWPHVVRISMSADQARFLFSIDERTGIDPASRLGVNATLRSLFLPPVRRLTTDLENPLEDDSYFSPLRHEIRTALFEHTGALFDRPPFQSLPRAFPRPMDKESPLNMQAVYVMDAPLVRDVLLDGGFFSISGVEGRPTKISLNFVADGLAPHAYRRRFFQQSPEEWKLGPPQFHNLRRELRNDLIGLLPNALELVTTEPDSAPQAWQCQLNQKYTDTGDPNSGVCESLEAITDLIQTDDPTSLTSRFTRGKDLKKLFSELVVDEAAKTGTRTSADNDLAEKLFITNTWRYPSGSQVLFDWREESPENQGWRWALVEQLLEPIFARNKRMTTPAERLERDKRMARFELDRKGETWILEVHGSEKEADLWKWRFLLPLGSIFVAKTFVLNHPRRSRLDADYRLT